MLAVGQPDEELTAECQVFVIFHSFKFNRQRRGTDDGSCKVGNFIIIMIKKFQLDNYTPKSKPNKANDKSDGLDRSMVAKRVRAQSHYKSNVRKPNLSMF